MTEYLWVSNEMKTVHSLCRVDSSIQGAASVTREIADEVEKAWLARLPGAGVVRRDLTQSPVSPAMWTDALMGRRAETPTPAQQAAVALATELGDEVLAADALLVCAPLYNWGVSGHVKCWIDMLWTDPRFAPRTYPLAGRPIVLVVARGGGASPGAPQEGWDHSVPYLVRMFGDEIFGGDVTVIETELTLADRSPAMAHLRDRAADLRARNHELAAATGAALGERFATD
ncbi:NAD(P)H-dependent oxidoreductase [Tsukamurella sp. 8F]|uniref:FMN-dependent NADH-azoreductase n=1 Tax=unclassified Tsukamurella TaxID=2633480 RepID=UPI0023B89993|nr:MULTISPECIES: NAD(P)H-dependent oxidoreductase [unclassified Tsukamurella]MDF0530584.1 NAD(P)H-dependent oxidoreductase [Tsukamurella sp. 8J]MDF0586766.1 NAD(P)H-dependent oxidoreductase [Tsukamurella sp. 8F]